MSFITVSKLREDGDFDVVVAYSEAHDTDEVEGTVEGETYVAMEYAENFAEGWGHDTGEQLYLHRVDMVTDVLDGKVKLEEIK